MTPPPGMVEAAPGSGIFVPVALAFKKGVGGLQALAVRGGWLLVRFNREGLQRRFSTDDIQWATTKYPHLVELLVRNGETLRRAQAMQSRLESIRGNPDCVGLESIDPDRPNLTGFDARNPDTLTRAVTYVDKSTDPPRRRFLFSEFGVGRFRVDEAAVQYTLHGQELDDFKQGKLGRFLSAAQLQQLKAGQTLAQLGVFRTAKDLCIHVLDLNRPISGSAMVRHFTKMLETKVALLEDLVQKLGLTPEGNIRLSAREVYVEAPQLYLDGKDAKVTRSGRGSSATTPRVSEVVVELKAATSAAGKTLIQVLQGTQVRRLMAMDAADLQRAMKAVDVFLIQAAEALRQVK